MLPPHGELSAIPDCVHCIREFCMHGMHMHVCHTESVRIHTSFSSCRLCLVCAISGLRIEEAGEGLGIKP